MPLNPGGLHARPGLAAARLGTVQRSAVLRLAIGVAISAIFLGLTLARVDLPQAAAAIGAAAPAGLALALAIVLVDLALRALRWKVLLDHLAGDQAGPPFRLAFGYLTIGFLANAVLPARLGDVARAYLAGATFPGGRLAILGSVVVERVADGLTMLALAALSVLAVGAVAGTGDLVVVGTIAAGAGVVGLVVAWFLLVRTRLGSSRAGVLVAGLAARVGAGANALRSPRPAATVVALTGLMTTTAVLVAASVTGAVGLDLSPIEVVLFLSGVALSLAIPAAPGAIGTYEFVGVTIITSLGYSPEQGLATILLMRVLTTLPPVLLGVVSVWVLQVRPGELVRPATTAATEP